MATDARSVLHLIPRRIPSTLRKSAGPTHELSEDARSRWRETCPHERLGVRHRRQSQLLEKVSPRLNYGAKVSGSLRTHKTQPPGGYWISVSSLNIGRYIAMMITPTTQPTAIIIRGSMIDVRLAMAESTSSS